MNAKQVMTQSNVDLTVKIFDKKSSLCIRTRSFKSKISQIKLDKIGNKQGIGLDDGSVQIYDIKHDKLVFALHENTKPINHIEFSDDGQYIITSSEDLTIKMWDMNKDQQYYKLFNHFQINSETTLNLHTTVNSIKIGNDNKLQIACSDGSVFIYNGDKMIDVGVGKLQQLSANTLFLDSENKLLQVGYNDGTTRVYDKDVGVKLMQQVGHWGSNKDIVSTWVQSIKK